MSPPPWVTAGVPEFVAEDLESTFGPDWIAEAQALVTSRAPLDVAVHRILSGRPKLKYYEAGMDMGLSYDRAESFRLFQARILEEYDKMVDTDNFVVLDGTIPVNKLQKQMRDIVASKIDLKRFAPRAAEAE